MRGYKENQQEDMFSYISMEDSIPKKHPLRKIKAMVDTLLDEMWSDFDGLYSGTGRPSIPPEQILKALLLQVLFTIRSERQMAEQLRYNLLYRWFVGLGMSGAAWDHSTFSKNRERLIKGGVADRFFSLVIEFASVNGLVSDEHFSVDGTLIEAWASLKTFLPKESENKKDDDDKSDHNRWVDFKGEKRSNETHESKTDPESKLYTKSGGQAAKLQFMGHVTMENRNGLVVDTRLTQATGTAEREAAAEMAMALNQGSSLGADKGYDTADHGEDLSQLNIKSHVAQNIHARKKISSIDGRTTRHAGYKVSQRKRMCIEEIFGWAKTIGLLRRPMLRGTEKLGWMFSFVMSVYNLVRIKNLLAA
ncbi:MAG: IS5 family transposase [Bdellovibrionaceae bacterium]|nr:IS5 family transposase [Pseudobdellovibrionaceae bacterium]